MIYIERRVRGWVRLGHGAAIMHLGDSVHLEWSRGYFGEIGLFPGTKLMVINNWVNKTHKSSNKLTCGSSELPWAATCYWWGWLHIDGQPLWAGGWPAMATPLPELLHFLGQFFPQTQMLVMACMKVSPLFHSLSQKQVLPWFHENEGKKAHPDLHWAQMLRGSIKPVAL